MNMKKMMNTGNNIGRELECPCGPNAGGVRGGCSADDIAGVVGWHGLIRMGVSME